VHGTPQRPPEVTVQFQPHISFARILLCAALAVFVAAPGASAQPNDAHCRVQLGAGLPFVPCPHGATPQHKSTLTPAAESSRLNAARAQQRYYARGETEPTTDSRQTAAHAQERYYTSYGNPTPMTPPSVPADDGGIDWAAIGIAIGGTCLLAGALIALVKRTRRRTGRVRAVA
jgi:hypothetical protein